MPTLIACLDVHYREQTACAAAIVFDEWSAATSVAQYAMVVTGSGAYEPGRFYLRELAPLLAVIERIEEPVRLFIIDAYCYLSEDGAPGLGSYLYAALRERAAVVGVAKRRFGDTNHAEELYRGGSARALFVTSLGLPQQDAAAEVASMAGRFRIPTLLAAVDRLARGHGCRRMV